MNIVLISTTVITAIASVIIIYFVTKEYKKIYKTKERELEENYKKHKEALEMEAESIKKNKIIEAKEKFLELKKEFEEEQNKQKGQLLAQQSAYDNKVMVSENRLKQKEQHLTQLIEKNKRSEQDIENQKKTLNNESEVLKKQQEELEKHKQTQISALEKISNLSVEEAREKIIENIKDEAKSKALSYVKDIMEEAKLTAAKESKKIVIQTIQRTASDHTIENCTSIFNIENDELKGKIIGREGRNIRAIEALTGVELIIDDTPEAIVISGFDPIRREVARLSLHRLVQDGRIHPGKIEEIVAKSFKNIEEEIMNIGQKILIELEIHGINIELVKMIGKMRYRSSYGQNLLHHSIEVAKLSATLAAELGLNPAMAKRAGLLHDIGKVSTEKPELPHALLGMELVKKYKEHPEICNAVGAHHDEIEMTSLISPIIQICDAISGSRPGARREVLESYIKRIEEIEQISSNFEGVTKCYALQSGREVRVIVDSENINDEKAKDISSAIAQKIEKEMEYPGQIKITVIREMRYTHYAK
ncbi:MAG: ribonuclease Y [Chitinophagaceae bacterium]|nr:ribonuclease Y [Chitinophagaceae bacterium]